MNRMFKRYLYFFLGVIINSFGVAFITKSALGTSQISSVPYVLSLKFPALSFGAFTFIMNMGFILLQVIILKKDFHPIQFLQVGANIIFSLVIDLGMVVLGFFQPETLAARLVSLLAGCVVLAFGICVEVAPNILFVPGEGLVNAISSKSGMKFGTAKICFDVTLIVVAGLLSFIFFGRLNGVGLGTVISALAVGKIVNVLNRHLKFFRKIPR